FHIKQDGTGNFTTIQEGINTSADSDTILVYPGTYFENIDYLEKSLTVASLYIITPEDSLINQTIIDGNQQASCVKIEDCENTSIIGFTIQNGYAMQEGVADSYQGGGIFIEDVTNSLISNCKIKNNKSYTGGGILIAWCNFVELSDNTIAYNQAIQSGGGIRAYGDELNIVFNSVSLNNIYLNYAATCSDISIPMIPNPTNVIVDTFTVNNPDYFFITSNDDISFSNLNAKIEEINQDLYVAPNGDDSNSGLTSDDPLQTLAWAQTIIKRNDENPNTIHLAEGTYSPTLNNQIFPLNVKHGVLYSGISPEETILEAEDETTFFFQFSKYQNEFAKLIVENLTMTNSAQLGSSYGGITIYQADINLTNVIIENCNGGVGSAILTANGYCNLNNVTIRNNTGGRGVSHSVEYNCPNPVLNATLKNSIFQNNNPGEEYYSGGAIRFGGHSNIQGSYNSQLINCEISDNYNNFYNPQTDMGGTSGLYLKDMVLVDVVNSTFGDNTLSHNTGCTTSVYNTELNLYNSILYNNVGYSINLWEDALVNISNSLIEGGDENVNYYYPLATVNWLGGNLDENPMFDSLGTYPFSLLENSPCINAGTLDLPAGIELPEFDLAGNPRIFGETIDMGAYEFQGDPQSNDENEIIIPEITQISNYPNPFNPSTTIKLDLAESGKIVLAIYNIKGQKVKTLLDAYSSKGHFEIIWRGTDDSKKKVSSGNYFIKLKVNGEEKAVSKCVLLK
ncbi:MAG: T9SS type A sorting domain-containing protein, partial [Candidatus Cloacimonetes bacterium]|nr:T9SS type A sorting domain-containing protein [Candidatus Cloacimonadota bacterium]